MEIFQSWKAMSLVSQLKINNFYVVNILLTAYWGINFSMWTSLLSFIFVHLLVMSSTSKLNLVLQSRHSCFCFFLSLSLSLPFFSSVEPNEKQIFWSSFPFKKVLSSKSLQEGLQACNASDINITTVGMNNQIHPSWVLYPAARSLYSEQGKYKHKLNKWLLHIKFWVCSND